MTQIFKKPDLQRKEREDYLKELDSRILVKECELDSITHSVIQMREDCEEKVKSFNEKARIEIAELDNILKIKRMERDEMDKPIVDRSKALDERALALDMRAKEIDEKEQSVFEREHQNEVKLDSLKDLSDDLGETRTRLMIKERLISGRESALKNRESQYLLTIENFNERDRKFQSSVQEQEYAMSMRELNLQSKDENLKHREKELLNGHILLNDRHRVLAKAWNELEKKKKTSCLIHT